MKRRHLMEEETFTFDGIEWRVMRCLPPDGYIDEKSTLYCHGEPISDCDKIQFVQFMNHYQMQKKLYTTTNKKYYLIHFFVEDVDILIIHEKLKYLVLILVL